MTKSLQDPLICLVGPTASGKSSIALALGQYFPLEIISVDSALVYRGMEIGTAKPSAAERAQVAHHLIDLIEPSERYSAAQFCHDAHVAIAAARARGHLPLLVGGTMLYFKALREGLDVLPAGDPVIRAQIEQQAQHIGWPALHAQLAQIDPTTAARLAPNDSQRIERALEVWYLTGQALSQLHTQSPASASPGFISLALEPADRAVLHQRIAQRFDAMLHNGFLDEVRQLRARGDLQPDLPSMRCVGYRQAWEYCDGKIDARQMREQAIAATRQLAKRQLTWLRALPQRVVVDCLASNVIDQIIRQIKQHTALRNDGWGRIN